MELSASTPFNHILFLALQSLSLLYIALLLYGKLDEYIVSMLSKDYYRESGSVMVSTESYIYSGRKRVFYICSTRLDMNGMLGVGVRVLLSVV